ncbi:hypothetical protein JCM10213v2_004349 [Rhodosporidiobolus nylandii]
MSAATATASIGGGVYTPPLAAGTATAAAATTTAAARTSVSYAQVASQTYTGTVTTSAQIVDSTGGVDSSSLLEYFTKPYLDAHTLSIPTWRYAYILWFAIVGILILWSIAYHLSGTGTGGSALGAWFRKWSIRRITWTRPPKTTYRAKRALPAFRFPSFSSSSPSSAEPVAAPPTPAGALHTLDKRGVNNPNGWAPFNDPLLASSNANIRFNTWTASARLGLISYAMLPLAVILALKQWPFNIFATPFLTNYHFDKTAILHRWASRVIWAFASGHSIGWFVQLSRDRDPFGRPVLTPVLQWYRFCAGIGAWVLLTIITAFSFKPLRNRYYELFYWSHVVLVALFLVACIVHHAPLLWWPLIALVWWGAERLVRFVTFLWLNGLFEGIGFREPARAAHSSRQSFSLVGAHEPEKHDSEHADGFADVKLGQQQYPPLPYDDSREPLHAGSMARQGSFSGSGMSYPPHSSPSMTLAASTSSSAPRALPPRGFASAQLLPGRTIRLTLHVPHTIRWAPGQHLLLYVPSVRFFDSHPYTIASVDERAKGFKSVGGGKAKRGSEVVLLVRAQGGFSKALWEYVVARRRLSASGQGVNLRAMVAWPMGSSGRTDWGAYESLTIVCGGTGITFGIAVLENACRRMARKGEDGKWKTNRVRFVWILREFAHLSWVASTLRRCIEMCDPSQLQVDLFVTHDAPKRPSRRTRTSAFDAPAASTDDLAPPAAPFARGHRAGSSTGGDSILSEMSDYSDGERSPTSSRFQLDAHEAEGGHDGIDSVTDLVLFDGEDDYRTAGEAAVSAQLKKEGKLRRALSRRGQGKSLRRPEGRTTPASSSPQQPLRPAAFGSDSTVFFEPLPLEHSAPPSPAAHYEPHSASFGDLGAVRAPSATFDYPYGFDDARSDAGTLVNDGKASSTRHLIKQPGGGFSSNRNSQADIPSLADLGGATGGGKVAQEDPDEAFFLDMTSAEQEDLDAIAELAKTGYPRLKEIIREEVDRSTGKTIVACCGPSSLNTIVRNIVSNSIDLRKVAKGDPRGQISLCVEDFSV